MHWQPTILYVADYKLLTGDCGGGGDDNDDDDDDDDHLTSRNDSAVGQSCQELFMMIHRSMPDNNQMVLSVSF